jgi:hypothetical protein
MMVGAEGRPTGDSEDSVGEDIVDNVLQWAALSFFRRPKTRREYCWTNWVTSGVID